MHGIWITCSILANMSWQVQGYFCRITRCHDSFEKYCSDKTKRCGIERLHDNSKYMEAYYNILMVLKCMPKVCNEGIAMYLEGILMYINI
jgi:hypothetical protein